MDKRLERILPRVQKPARYVGGEYNAVMKDLSQVDTRVAFCFPVVLAAHIARGLLHAGQDAFQSFVHRQAPFLSRDINRILHAFCAARKPQLPQRSPKQSKRARTRRLPCCS